MTRDTLPEPWRSTLEAKRISSIRGLAAAAGISPMAASRLVKGQGIRADTVTAVADKLFAGDRNRVWKLHGAGIEDHGDWTLPAEASVLTTEQREAVLGVVRAFLPSELKSGGAGKRRLRALPDDKTPDEWVGKRRTEQETAEKIGADIGAAAKKAKSAGQARRRQQDEEGEAGGA